MDWIFYMQNAIDYIEDNLLESIDYNDVAKRIGFSNFHFHRTFALLAGMTANEYIRKRRLSMAGEELSMSNAKIIDIAFKYGYETPESFSKAFSRFHGFNPSDAKKSGTFLKKFSRFSIKVKVEGGKIMDYKIEEKGSMKFLTASKSFLNEIINEKGNREISDFWTESFKNGTIETLKKNSVDSGIYGLCLPVSKESDSFKYGIGIKITDIHNNVENFEIWTVKPSMWAVFKCIGNDGQCIADMWERIFSEFLPTSPYKMTEQADLEYYYENNENIFCELWIPVEKK